MFTSYKCAQIISRQILRLNNLRLCNCLSTESNMFVSRARFLDKVKTEGTVPELLYKDGKYILFMKNEMVCVNNDYRLILKEYEDIQKWNEPGHSQMVLIGVLPDSDCNTCLFAVNLDDSNVLSVKDIENETKGRFVNIRQSMLFLNAKEAQYVLHARGLLNFRNSIKFCCFCGGCLQSTEIGNRKKCSNCNVDHYPQVSPVGLSLIEHANHQEVLLVRQSRHPPGMYTCVAGFVEPGESLEENMAREIAEEVGVNVTRIEYCTSQHWAMPSSQLALGCIATTEDRCINIDPKEIEDAKWVDANTLKEAVIRTRTTKSQEALDGGKLWVAPQSAVSHNLILIWLKRYHNFDVEPTS